MTADYKIFAINPGSTSTKIALYEGKKEIFNKNVKHEASELAKFPQLKDQLPYRRDTILNVVKEQGYTLEGCDCFVGRGGGLESCQGGTYDVNEIMLEHAKNGKIGRHPATLGSQIASEFAQTNGGRAFIVNPPDVDELIDEARITGLHDIFRESRIHALNQKETCIQAAADMGGKYEDYNFVAAHIGGGVSITAHRNGKAIDNTDI
jgi:butyrate kinase